ncbi:hypothetical protein [Desulfosarcina sp.]|uniref:hypothetical protein n=1 Tax=Desulfosarcina sp. TaxID=2027861 RepID=UPI0035676FB5
MLELLVEKENELHDQAIFEFFSRLVSSVVLSIKKTSSMVCPNNVVTHGGEGLLFNRPPRIPV